MKRLCLILVLFIYVKPVYAEGFVDELKDKLRPYAVKYLGEETAFSIFGEGSSIELPKIPKVNTDAKQLVSGCEDSPEILAKINKEEQSQFNYLYIKEVFQAARNSEPNGNEVGKWMNVLNQDGTREGVYRAIVLDTTYQGLENYENPVNDAVINWALDYFPKFMGRGIKKSTLEKTNFYTLKRVTTDRTLEVLDTMCAMKRNDMYDWYAIFSSELAQNYPNAWRSKIRKTISKQAHKKWAKSVPVQNLKSEVIVKLNTLFNFLMQ